MDIVKRIGTQWNFKNLVKKYDRRYEQENFIIYIFNLAFFLDTQVFNFMVLKAFCLALNY